MEQDKMRKPKGKFIRLMYEKGYRGMFFLDKERQRRMAVQDELPACLEQIIKGTQEQNAANNRFGLDRNHRWYPMHFQGII
jgi:hypothetical protein